MKILVFKHMPSQNPGIFREFAAELDVQFTEIDLHAGEPIPDLTGFDALWVMGGSMDVWEEEEHPWLVQEKIAIHDAVREMRMPFFGFCFGHQLLAEALGGKVEPCQQHEIGVFPISPTVTGQDHTLLRGLPELPGWINVHSAEITVPPPGAVILAESDLCSNHIMEVDSLAYSCQFHPEVCDTTVHDWLLIPGIEEYLVDRLGADGFLRFQHDVEHHRHASNRGARILFQNWVDLVIKSGSQNRQNESAA